MKNPPKKTTSKKKEEEESDTSSSSNHDVILNGDIHIDINHPLPHLDKGDVKAYQAFYGSTRHGANLFALLTGKSKTPRFLMKGKYANINNPNLCKFNQMGTVFWPADKQEKFCFVYEDTMGKPFIDSSKKAVALGWKPEIVLSNIVPSMISLLIDLRNKEITHGEIWPGNMFDGGAKAGHKIYLGECLSSPASSNLPALYEPIERALADPMGRGAGDILDDIYSFGASLAVMLRTEDPMKGVPDDKVIEYKIEKGSYAALLGKERLSGGLLELLRGMLYDDPAQRWTIEDLEAWQDGRRLSPKQSPKRARATRPIMFNNKKYTQAELLAKDLHLDVDEASKLITNGDLDQWIERAIEEKTVKVRLEQALKSISSYERGNHFSDRSVVTVAHALFTDNCVQYRNVNFVPAGFGKYLTHAYLEKMDLEPFVEVIKYSFLTPIMRESRSSERGTLVTNFDNTRSAIKQKTMNSGLERCLYLMNPESPCLSPILDKYYVRTSVDMMNAFEAICEKSDKSTVLFDRHIIAFLSIKDRQNIDPYLSDLSSAHAQERAIGQLKVLATMQKRLDLKGYPAIAKWVMNSFGSVFDRFHDSKKREVLKKRAEKMVVEGSLTGLASIFDGENLYVEDVSDFFQAVKHYKSLVKEQELIKNELKKGSKYGQNTGRQIASVISMVLSFLIMLVTVYNIFSVGS